MRRGDKVDTFLTLIFMLLVVAAMICYFAMPDNRIYFWYTGGAAICLRLVHYMIRFMH